MKTRKMKELNLIRREAAVLVGNPALFYFFVQLMQGLGVVGEQLNALILFLACITRNFALAVSVIMKGSSSSGKSSLLRSIVNLCPEECVIKLASLSAKAPVYGDGDFHGKIFYLYEYRGGKDSMYLTRLQQSEGDIAHEYTTISGRYRRTVVARRTGIPVVLTTTTDQTVFADDETRFLSLRADESPDLTRQIIKNRLSPAPVNGTQPRVEVWREVLRLLGRDVPTFRYPAWFEFVADLIPADEPRARRDVERFRSLLEAVALCRSYSDGRRRRDTKTLEIDFADYCVAYRILNQAFSSTYRATHPQALQAADTVLRLYRERERCVSVEEIADTLGWQRPLTYKWVKRAAADNLIEYEPGTRAKNLKRLLPGPVRNLGFLPSPGRVFAGRSELGDSVVYVDPLTGDEMTMSRKRKEKSAEVKE